MLAVVVEVRFRPKNIGDFLLRTWRDGLVGLYLWNGQFIRARDVVLR